MDYFYLVQDVIDFIEENLLENLNIDVIASHFNISKFHFQRLFKAATDENLVHYIRKRILSESIKDLEKSNGNILDIAIKYNYNSQEAYTRAFKKIFNINPGGYSKNPFRIEAFNKIDILKNNIIKKSCGHLFQIEEMMLPSMNFIGYKKEVISLNFEAMIKAWKKVLKYSDNQSYVKNPNIHYNICKDGIQGQNSSFIAAIESLGLKENPYPLIRFSIPSQKYVVFYHKGKTKDLKTEGADDTIDLIFKTWLTFTEYELDSKYVSLIGITDETNYQKMESDTIIKFLVPIKN